MITSNFTHCIFSYYKWLRRYNCYNLNDNFSIELKFKHLCNLFEICLQKVYIYSKINISIYDNANTFWNYARWAFRDEQQANKFSCQSWFSSSGLNYSNGLGIWNIHTLILSLNVYLSNMDKNDYLFFEIFNEIYTREIHKKIFLMQNKKNLFFGYIFVLKA